MHGRRTRTHLERATAGTARAASHATDLRSARDRRDVQLHPRQRGSWWTDLRASGRCTRPPFWRAVRVLVRAHDRAVDVVALGVGVLRQLPKRALPDALLAPAREPRVHALPRR